LDKSSDVADGAFSFDLQLAGCFLENSHHAMIVRENVGCEPGYAINPGSQIFARFRAATISTR
jgi:hypothetical protein